MKLETIKKDKKKKIIIGSMIVLSVVGCLTLTTTKAKYRSIQSLKLASGTVKLNQYDFKIMAMYQSEDGETYTDINIMPETGYVINEEKSYCTADNKTQVKGKLKTVNGIHGMYGLAKNDKCYIWFDIKPLTSKDTILRLNIQNIKTKVPNFTQIATGIETEENNGIYETDDPMYGTGKKAYYWRGAATTNHVIFDNKCWRIVRINGDGSIRLIFNGVVQSGNTCKGNGSWDGNIVLKNTAYNSNYNNSKYVGWTYASGDSQRPSSAKPQDSGTEASLKTILETWYSNNITDKNKIVKGYFCNDRNIQNNETWRATGDTQYYATYQRLFKNSNKTPQLSCPNGDIYELNIGMIVADEAQFAGASGTTSNTAYYLYNGQQYWTMSPYQWYYYNYSTLGARVSYIETDGQLSNARVDSVSWPAPSVRPVINLRSDVTFNAGSDGTQNNPYIVQ